MSFILYMYIIYSVVQNTYSLTPPSLDKENITKTSEISVCVSSVIPFSLPNTWDYLNPKYCISHSWISLYRLILIYVCVPSQYSTYQDFPVSDLYIEELLSEQMESHCDIFQELINILVLRFIRVAVVHFYCYIAFHNLLPHPLANGHLSGLL